MVIATGNFPGTPAVTATLAFALFQTIAMSLVALRREDRPIFTGTEEGNVNVPQKQRVALFVDKCCQQWVVRDPEGSFWILPSVEHPWDHRQPFHPTAETELESVPGHYKDMLRLPF